MYNAPREPQAAPAPPSYAAPPRRYPGLRFVASTCVVSAWITLALSVPGGILMMFGGGLTAAAQIPALTGGADTGSGPGAAAGHAVSAIAPILASLQFAGGVFTLVTGVGGFLVLLAAGLLIYVILDMEENTRTAAQAMSAIARRMGMPG